MRFECGGSTLKSLLVALLIVAFSAPPALGQESNLDALRRLGVSCLLEAPGDLDTFRLSPPDSMAYLRTALTNQWIEGGKRVTFGADAALPTLRYSVKHASVTYRRLRRNTFSREVRLSVDYTLLDNAGVVLDDGLCAESAVDTLRISDLALLEDPAHPETIGDRPSGGFVRRIVEPAVMVAAVGIGVFLFFTLRSDGSGE